MKKQRSSPLPGFTPSLAGKKQKRGPSSESDIALVDEVLYSNETPPSRGRRSSDFSPSLTATGLKGDFALESSSSSSSSPKSAAGAVDLSPETAQKVIAALGAAFNDDADRFKIEFDDMMNNFTVLKDHFLHLNLLMDSTDGKEVYLDSLKAGHQVRGKELLARLDTFARDFGVRSIRLHDAASITLTGADGEGVDIDYSTLTILATGLSYYNYFGYSAIDDADAIAAHNTELSTNMSFESALKAATDAFTSVDDISDVLHFLDEHSVAFFGGHRAANSTARQIFAHLLSSGALKRGGSAPPVDGRLATWIAKAVALFSESKSGINVPSPVRKTSFAVGGVVEPGGGRMKTTRTIRRRRRKRRQKGEARRRQAVRRTLRTKRKY